MRTNPEIIYCSDSKYGKETAKKVLDIMQEYRNQDVEIIYEKEITDKKEIIKSYQEIIEKEKGKNVLIINDEKYFETIWLDFYGDLNEDIEKLEVIKLPTYKITNELDKRILAELNNIGIEIENAMETYQLDIAAKFILGFIDRLNNRYIRRSRRRFRESGMNEDKISAYNTLFKTLKNYVKLCAPFVPFISEHIYLQLLNFKGGNHENNKSVHLLYLPIFSKKYINQNLLNEIGFVRRIISLGLFIRSKNNIKTKQPLQKIEIK